MGSRRQAQIDRALASYAPRPVALLTDEAARAALDALAGGASVKSVAERFGVSIWCIYDLRLGRTFKHLARERLQAPRSCTRITAMADEARSLRRRTGRA